MRKIIMMLSLVLFLFTTLSVWAHPAKRVDLTFDKKTRILTATIVHEVKDNTAHYTKDIQITITGRDGLTHNLIRQDNLKGGIYKYRLNDVNMGDVISLTTTCSIQGQKTAVLTIK